MADLRVLIVDDEPLIRSGIRKVISGLERAEVSGECGSGSEAIREIRAGRHDVVLLDVQMPDRSGLDVIREVGVADMPAVVFVTAHDEHAVTAFEVNAVDYVLKPFSEERLKEAVERARTRLDLHGRSKLTRQLEALLEADRSSRPDTLVVRDGERFDFVPLDSIDWIESANNYVELHCGTKTHVMPETLASLEARLTGRTFLRVHRCRIVNTSRIVAAHSTFAGAYDLELRSGVRIGTGRQYRAAIQRLLQRG